MLIFHLFIIFGEMSVQVFDSFFNQVVYFLTVDSKDSLYILETVIYQTCLLQILSPSLWLVFCSFESFFAEQKHNELQLINYFTQCVFGIVFKKSLSNKRPARFSFMFYSSGFIVFLFLFRSVIHFEIIFGMGVRSVFRFLSSSFFKCEHLVVPAPLVEKIIFAPFHF